MGPLPIIWLSPGEQVIVFESDEKYAQTKHHLQVRTVQNSSKQLCLWIMWEDNREWTFTLDEVLLWIMEVFWS